MSISISFYNFTKRENSTTQPTGTGTTYQGYSREPMSLMNPVIGFKLGQTAPSYNYAFSADMGNRYYFVTDWTYSDGLWYATMKTDVLATYRSAIGASSNYILRASAAYDGYITDTYYPLKQGSTVRYSEFLQSGGGTPWPLNTDPNSGGWYIVGIVNSDGAAIGGVSYYCLNNTNFRTLMQTLLSSVGWTGVDFTTGEISEGLFKSLFNPMQYIVSCLWTPVTPPMSTAIAQLTFGWWTLNNVTAYRLTATTDYLFANATLPKHPQASSRGAYLNASPFTRLTVINGPFGEIPLDTTLYVDSTGVDIRYTYDFISGKAMANIGPHYNTVDYDHIDKTVSITFAVPIQLSQVVQDFVGGATGLLQAGKGAVTGAMGGAVSGGPVGAIAGAIGGAASGIISAAESMLPQVQSAGLNGSFAGFRYTPRLQIETWNAVSDDNADRGRPFCRKATLQSYPGYLLIADPDIATAGTAEETEKIREYMSSGFFFV